MIERDICISIRAEVAWLISGIQWDGTKHEISGSLLISLNFHSENSELKTTGGT